MSKYTDEKNIQILIALLKEHNIKKIIASPGATNVTFVRSLQNDDYFEMYSAVDERSAAYMACGLSAESGEPVVISCTGATASRNYMPGLTEAFYRKLPILSVTSTQDISKVGHHIAQVIDRSVMPKDTVRFSTHIPLVKDEDDFWSCKVKINTALLELSRYGGGPVHINLTTKYSKNYNVEKLPIINSIKRFTLDDKMPNLNSKKIGIVVGSHNKMSEELISVIDNFCELNNAVVFCDHTSGYYGKYRIIHSISSSQRLAEFPELKPEISIHIGDVSGDYSIGKIVSDRVWRVSEDGEIRDTFRKLEFVFEMKEINFFKQFLDNKSSKDFSFYQKWENHVNELNNQLPDIPYSNLWVANKSHKLVPNHSVLHFGILNSLRSWNFFDISKTIETYCNVGAFGIDGCVSSLLGASLVNKDKLYFAIVGDLAFFYDMNSIGNRHLSNNVRILLINNGTGTEFRNFNHPASAFGESSDEFHAAGGHFGNKSSLLVKNYTENLGFKYLSASNKQEFENVYKEFFNENITKQPIFLEVFTNSDDESNALESYMSFAKSTTGQAKNAIKSILGQNGVSKLKGFLKK